MLSFLVKPILSVPRNPHNMAFTLFAPALDKRKLSPEVSNKEAADNDAHAIEEGTSASHSSRCMNVGVQQPGIRDR